ncbi:ras-related protein Rab-9A-like [Watersipora subatra]|uniref:ras-related protein Rab-9A-like n=1 Tax=Watersipora subatra TaxID=2589382 RepID=UPI00355BC21C
MSVSVSMNRNSGRSRMLKVVLLGDGKVGKSSLMNRYVCNKFDSQSFHTIGVEFLNKEIFVDDQTYTIQIWDTAGQERFKSLRTPFYRGSDCCLLTFSVDDEQSFRNLNAWKEEFLYYSDVPDSACFPFIVIGNKIDLVNRTVTREKAASWCEENDMPYFETSAKDNMNVETAFVAAVKRFKELEGKMDTRHKPTSETINLRTKKSDDGGCC